MIVRPMTYIYCYKPMKYIDIICIATSIIYAFDTHGKHSNPQAHHLSYDAIIRNHEHYCSMEFIKENSIYKSIFETCPIVSNITTNCSKSHCKYLWKNPKIFTNKIHEEWKPMETCAHNPAHVSKPKQLTKRQLETHTKEPSFWEWTKGCPINFLPSSAWREQCPRAVISAEVKRMKRLHDLPQNCTFSGRGAETKLSKLQQIDAINVKNN